MHNQNDESNILNQLSLNSKNHQPSTIIMPNKREKLNISKSIIYKRIHSNNYTLANLQKLAQVKTIEDNA